MAITIVKQKVISTLTLILAIPCSDRIVIAADGRSTDYETSETLEDTTKIFEITNNSAILIAGGGLVDELDKYMDGLIHEVRARGNTNIADIARDVKEIIDRRNWAEWKDDREKSHMSALVVGYDTDKPRVYAISDNRSFIPAYAYSFGNWDNALNYLAESVSSNHIENTKKNANRVAIEVLSKAKNANPKEIGEPFSIWHVLLTRIHKLDGTDISNLLKRYGGKVYKSSE